MHRKKDMTAWNTDAAEKAGIGTVVADPAVFSSGDVKLYRKLLRRTPGSRTVRRYANKLYDKTSLSSSGIFASASSQFFSNLNEYIKSEGEIIPQIPIQFNEINRKGRVWDDETKSNFVEDCERLGIKTVSVKYKTKGNTKAYYRRFCKSLGRPTKIG